jgi:hypothetical protein
MNLILIVRNFTFKKDIHTVYKTIYYKYNFLIIFFFFLVELINLESFTEEHKKYIDD